MFSLADLSTRGRYRHFVLCMFSLADSSTRGRHCRFVLCVCFHLLIYPLHYITETVVSEEAGDPMSVQVVKIMTCGGQRPEGVVDDHHFLYSYLTYLRLKTAVGRNMLLIEQLRRQSTDRRADDGQRASKPQALARLYDTIIQVCASRLIVPLDDRLRYLCVP